MEFEIINNKEQHQFEAHIDDLVCYISYTESPTTLSIISTHVPQQLGGKGIAAKLTKYALEYAKLGDLKVDPICSYTKSYIDKNTEYKDLLLDE